MGDSSGILTSTMRAIPPSETVELFGSIAAKPYLQDFGVSMLVFEMELGCNTSAESQVVESYHGHSRD